MQAKIIYNDESSSQIMIDKARAVLNEAINSLEKKVIIKDNLERLISEVEGLNGLDYTDVSWEFLSEVLKKAKIKSNLCLRKNFKTPPTFYAYYTINSLIIKEKSK